MYGDQPLHALLRPGTTRRLEFLLGRKEQGGPRVHCRLPGCGTLIYRRSDKGRNKWFCEPECADLFHHRRRALDDAIDELARHYDQEDHSWRSRKDLESYIRYLLAARTAYFAPTDWQTPQGDLLRRNDSTETQVLVESWRYLARRPDARQECPVCWGQGYLPTAPAPTPTSAAAKQGLVARIAAAVHVSLHELFRSNSGLLPPEWLRHASDWADAQRNELDRLLTLDDVYSPRRPEPAPTLGVLSPTSDQRD